MNRRAHPAEARFSVWQSGDNWPIRRLDWPQPPGAPVRGSLVFAGGRGDFIEKYLEPLAHWHAQGWDVTSFDWRSQGASRGDITGGHLDSFDPLVADGAGFLEDWASDRPGPHVAIAHSMGGHLLLRIVAEHRPALAAAVLVAPMLGINASPLSPAVAASIASGFCALGHARTPAYRDKATPSPSGSRRQTFLTSCKERYADEHWWLEQQPGFNLGAPSWGWLRAAYQSIARLSPAQLRSVELPILLVGTEQDRLVSAAAIRSAAGLLPNAELLMFPDAGHEILRESDPVRLEALARIDAFLDAHARG